MKPGLDRFEDSETNLAFRRTFLHACPTEMVPALSTMGSWIYRLVLEYGRPSGGWCLVPRLRAALEDLKFLHSYFASLDNDRNESILEAEDLEVSRLAARLMPPMAKLIERIESELAQLESSDDAAAESS